MANRETMKVSETNGVDLDELADQMKRQLMYYTYSFQNIEQKPNFMIRKIHSHLKSIEKNMYKPAILSLGPYHHGKQAFQHLENEKWKCLNHIAMTNQQNEINIKYMCERTLERYVGAMECIEKKARDVYRGDIVMDGIFFSQVMFLDGCFILAQVLWSEQIQSDYISPYLKAWKNPHVVRDMMLLENQIPFFVVEKINDLLIGEHTTSSLREKAVTFVEQMIHRYVEYVPYDPTRQDFDHLLHLCQMYFKPIQNHDEVKYHVATETCWRRATIYADVGINIRRKRFDKNNPHSLLDVTFHKNTMEIPQLWIDSHTVTLLKNLVTLEQTCPQYGNHVTTYVIFLSQFMCTPDDIKFLVKKGIISHSLHSDDKVSNLFLTLGGNVVFDFNGKYYLKNVNHDVEESFQKCLDRLVVRTGLNRLPSPCHCFFMVAGFIYVFMVCISTYFVARNYYNIYNN